MDENVGEHSQNNPLSDEERPFKKARYVWQLKGKYHLRNKENLPENGTSYDGETSRSDCAEEESFAYETNNNNNDVNKSRFDEYRNCCLETLLTTTEKLMEGISESDEEYCNVYISQNESPVTMVKIAPQDDESLRAKWQANQVI